MNLHLGELADFVNQKAKSNKKIDIRAGDTVRVHYRIKEGGKERVQIFEGIVISVRGGSSLSGSFTVRKVVAGIGVERTFPIHSPWIIKIDRSKSSAVRRGKLYFIRRYALSRRFKLKDKDVKGTVWEEIADEHNEIEKSQKDDYKTSKEIETPIEEELEKETVAKDEEISDNVGNDISDEKAGESGGEPSDSVSEEEKVSDSK